MADLAKILILAGAALCVAGIILLFAGKIPGLGRVPGDIVIRKENLTFYFPVVTCLLISLLLTIILNIFHRSR